VDGVRTRTHAALVFEPGHVRIRRDPLGVTLIIGAWNEPFMLLFVRYPPFALHTYGLL
jgi:acyl-CoA reductase-like NAD-dependent aldehyde dehydrogenase